MTNRRKYNLEGLKLGIIARRVPVGSTLIDKQGYVRVKVAWTRQWQHQHRVVWAEAHGPIPKGACIHHINHDKTDNRIENLQLMESNSKHALLHDTLATFNRQNGFSSERRAKMSAAAKRRLSTDEGKRNAREAGKKGAAAKWGHPVP